MIPTMTRRATLTGLAALPVLSQIRLAHGRERPNLVIATADNPPTIEPARELSNVGTRITYSVFDTLIRRDFLGEPGGGGADLKPGLAVSWKRLGDDALELELRKGVTFHDGAPFTARDVAFTFSAERLSGPDALVPEGRAYFAVIDRIDVVDEHKVVIRTKGPDALLEQRLASWASWIVNEKDWRARAGESLPRDPVGTGPYRLVEIRDGEHIRLEAFDAYWGAKPTAASVTFKVVPEVAARVAGLVSGEFDIIVNVPPDQIPVLERYEHVEPRSVVLANSHVLVYNTLHPVLQDKRVRQALNLAIDRDLLNQALWGGQAVVPNSHQYPEYGYMYAPERNGLVYDPKRARKLLAEAGYAGEPVIYRTMASYYVNALPAAQALVEMWRAVGIDARLEVVEQFPADDTKMIRNWSNSTRYPDPLGALWIAWGEEGSAQRSKSSGTWAGPATDRFNALGRELARTTDPERRFALGQQMLDIWEEDAPGTILYQPLETYGVRKDLLWQPCTFYYMDLRGENLQLAGQG